MKLWQLIKGIETGKYVVGDKFRATHPNGNNTVVKFIDRYDYVESLRFADNTTVKISTFCMQYDFKKIKRRSTNGT